VLGTATGTAALTLSNDETELSFEVSTDLDPAEITQAHLHVAPRGFNGPVVLFLTSGSPPFALPLQGTLTEDDLIANADVSVESFADFVAALKAGDVYVNVHTNDNPAGAIRGQVQVPTTFVATLSGDQEVPPVVGVGTGTAALILSADETELSFEVSTSLDPAEITQAHLHVAPRGINGPVLLFLTSGSPPFTLPLQGTLTADDLIANPGVGVETFADFVAALKAGDVYVNVHTQDNPAGEIRGQVQAARTFVSELTGDQEVPPVETTATGRGQVVVNSERSALRFAVSVADLPADQITQAHIHVAPAGFNGPVVVFLADRSFNGLRIGTLTEEDIIPRQDVSISTFADLLAALEAGDAYINVHSMDNPAGEVRGQVQPSMIFPASLTGDQENPPVETDATGVAQVALSADGSVLRFAVSVADLSAEQITQAHIHVAPIGMNGPVVFLQSPSSFTSPLIGMLTEEDFIPASEIGVETFADFIQRLRNGETYVNVHTQANEDGEVRGQLQAPVIFNAMLTGDQESPPVETDASGNGRVTLSADRTTLRFAVAVFDLPSDQITQAHIHVAPVGMNGPVVLFLADSSFTSPLVGALVADDLIPSEEIGVVTFDDFLARLFAGETYINVHTQANQDGEVRGQLSEE
jgi:hypothetical protein